jgi:hypothetical protein
MAMDRQAKILRRAVSARFDKDRSPDVKGERQAAFT